MKNYIVVFKENRRAAAFVKGETVRCDSGLLQIVTDEHGTVFLTPLDLVHHVLLADDGLVVFKGPDEI